MDLTKCQFKLRLQDKLNNSNLIIPRQGSWTPASAMRLEMQPEAGISGEIQEKKKSINTVAASHLGNLLKIQIIDLHYKDLDFNYQPRFGNEFIGLPRGKRSNVFCWVKYT